MHTKQEIRQKHRAKRDAMDSATVSTLSETIRAHLLASDLVRGARTWFVYVSYGNEVATHGLIRTLLEQICRVAVPLVVGDNMIAREIRSLDELRPGAWGILQPPPGEPLAAFIDVCVCPGLAFTEHGDRLGMGRAYYDRTLAAHRSPLVVGLAYDWQVVRPWTIDAFDQKMDLIVTERHSFAVRTTAN